MHSYITFVCMKLQDKMKIKCAHRQNWKMVYENNSAVLSVCCFNSLWNVVFSSWNTWFNYSTNTVFL